MKSVLTNKVLLEKADLALADLTNGGALVPEQAAKFIRLMIKQGVLTTMGTVKTMRSSKFQIPKARFGGRVLHAGQSAKALPVASRSRPDLTQVELDTKLFKAEVRLSNEVLEDSVERDKFADTVMALMSEAIGRDIDEIAILSDVTDPDDDLSQFDGLIAQANSNLVLAGGVSLNKATLRDMQKSMPSEFLRYKAGMKFLTSVDAEIDYRDSLANRMTSTGDSALAAFVETQATVGHNGIPVVPLHMMPEDLGVGSNETVALLLEPKQIIFGFQRDITFEMDRDISAGEALMVLSCRWDVKYEHEPAVVKATGITVG